MNFWILSSRLARTRRDLANNSDKKPKIRRKFAKKIHLKNRKIRDPGILLALSLSKMHQKNVLVHALFRDPLSRRRTLSFSDLNAIMTRSTLSDVVEYAQRTLAECTQFLCAGRAEFPEFLQIFRPIFAQILRNLGAGLALYLALERMPTRKREATKFHGLRNNAGRVHAIFLRAARRKFSGNMQFFENFLFPLFLCMFLVETILWVFSTGEGFIKQIFS